MICLLPPVNKEDASEDRQQHDGQQHCQHYGGRARPAVTRPRVCSYVMVNLNVIVLLQAPDTTENWNEQTLKCSPDHCAGLAPIQERFRLSSLREGRQEQKAGVFALEETGWLSKC